jgi:signal transduction histidine kinase
MLNSPSSEFIALCRLQVTMLVQGLGASLSVVYLTEDLTNVLDAKLVPIAAYPEAAAHWPPNQVGALLEGTPENLEMRLLTAKSLTESSTPALPAASEVPPTTDYTLYPLQLSQQIVLPLIHENVMMGLLVTARSDRPWDEQEQSQIEKIAATLSLACVLDQRSQWLDQNLQHHQLLQTRQHDMFDDLLHQFRNPLTALRTFGKLLVKRLRPSDPNQEVAVGIVRESDRLQDLLKQFDSVLDWGNANLLPTSQSHTPVQSTSEQRPVTLSPDSSVDKSTPVQSTLLLPSSHFLAGRPLQLAAYSIAEVLEPLLKSAQAIAQDRHLRLQVDLPANLPAVKTDIKILQEILNNVIDNALKYTAPGGSISIWAGQERWFAEQKQQAIAIADTGPGIPPEDLAHLFERHYRGVQAATNIPGTGLGLAIAHDLVMQIQGEIQVFSPISQSNLPNPFRDATHQPHPGTLFVVWLPEANLS